MPMISEGQGGCSIELKISLASSINSSAFRLSMSHTGTHLQEHQTEGILKE